MKRILLVAICFALLVAGCIEQKDAGGNNAAKAAEGSAEKLMVAITSPGAGEILKGNSDVKFDAIVGGGRGSYAYRWSSSIDGTLSTKRSYQQNPSKLSKGEHTIILTAADASGRSAQASVIIQVM